MAYEEHKFHPAVALRATSMAAMGADDAPIDYQEGGVYAGLGTAALPSFTFSGDTNTGIYRSAADTIGFAIAGALDFSMSANSFNVLASSHLDLADSSEARFGDADDLVMRWDGTDFDILPLADDQVIKIGNGTNSFDLWIYGNAAADYVLWDASLSEMVFTGSAFCAGAKRRVVAKTGDYTITAADSGKVLTNRGAAGAVIFTLPTVAAAFDGVDVTVYVVAAQDVTVSAQTAGQIVTFNDATANSMAFSTASEKIGGGFRCVCDGTSWLVLPFTWADVGGATQTASVVT